jgi:hypothetical protein
VKSNFGPSRTDELADEWEISGIDADFQVAAPPFATSQILVKHPEQTEIRFSLSSWNTPS